MQKENALGKLIEQLVKEEVDKAFNHLVTEVEKLNMTPNPLNLETDADATSPPPAQAIPPSPPPASSSNTPAEAPGAPGMVNPLNPTPDSNPLTGGTPGAPNSPSGPNSPATVPSVATTTGAATVPGSIPATAPDGGATGMIPGGDTAMENEPSESEGDVTDGTGITPGAAGSIVDPIAAMVDGAQELLSQTQDPNLILKSLKGQIQTVFKAPEHALGMIKALYDTNNLTLQSVAQRLYLFMKSGK